MYFTAADPLALICFIVVLFGVTLAYVIAAPRIIRKKVIIAIALWLTFFSLFTLSGVLEIQPMPLLPIYFGLANIGALVFAISPWGRRIAHTVPIVMLVVFQGFRLPLELVLHSWALQGVIPETMTWGGQNFDIITGLLALLLAPLTTFSRISAWIVNIVGFALLLNVMRVAVMSSPLPFAWNVHPPLLLATHFPYCLIIPVCVGGALAGHIILTRALLHQREMSLKDVI